MKFLLSIFALLCCVSFVKPEIRSGSCSQYNARPIRPFFRSTYENNNFSVYGLTDYEETVGQDCIKWSYGKSARGTRQVPVYETSKNLQTNTKFENRDTMYFDRRGTGQYTYSPGESDQEFVKIIEFVPNSHAVEFSCQDNAGGVIGQHDFYIYFIYLNEMTEAKEARFKKVSADLNNDFDSVRIVEQSAELCGSE